VYTSHGHKIKYVPDNGVPFEGRVHRCGGPGNCSVCTFEAYTAVVQQPDVVAPESAYSVTADATEYHDDETLHKVFNALVNGPDFWLTGDEARSCITMMQNAGILFRERIK
jgi:hypothetical protein